MDISKIVAIVFLAIIIIILVGLIFLWIYIYYIRKKENNIFIHFNKLQNNQAIKREKFIQSISGGEKNLETIIFFLKNQIKEFEDKLNEVQNNILLLRRIKIFSDFRNYNKKLNIIQNDLCQLEKKLKEIDNYALDSTGYKNNSLTFFLLCKNAFTNLEDFYYANLIKKNYGSDNFFLLIIDTKKHFEIINQYIVSPKKNEIFKGFQSLIENINKMHSWCFKIYLCDIKLSKIIFLKNEWDNILKNNNLHLSSKQKNEIEKDNFHINELINQYKNNLKTNKDENIQKEINFILNVENNIDDLLKKVFRVYNKINFIFEQQKILNNLNIEKFIFNPLEKNFEYFNKKVFILIHKWSTNFDNCAKIISNNSTNMIENAILLKKGIDNWKDAKKNIKEYSNIDLINYLNNISESLINVNLESNNLRSILSKINLEYFEIIEKVLKVNIKIPQLISLTEELMKSDDEIINDLKKIEIKSNDLIKIISLSYDKCLSNRDIIDQLIIEYKIFEEKIQLILSWKLLAQKLINYVKILKIKNNIAGVEGFFHKLKIMYDKKEWRKVAENVYKQIQVIYHDVNTNQEKTKISKFFKKFLNI